MKEKVFVFVKDEWLDKLSHYNTHIPRNYEHTGRPYFFGFKDNEKNDIMWLIPISSKVEKYKKVRDKILEKKGRCYNFHFAKVKGEERCFEIQSIFPALKKHLDGTYNLSNGNLVRILYSDAEQIEKLGTKVVAMAKQDKKIFISDIKGMYNATVAELEKDKVQTAPPSLSSASEAKVPATVGATATHHTDTSANTNTAQPTVSAAAADMLGNMFNPAPTGAQQTLHTSQNKNANISE